MVIGILQFSIDIQAMVYPAKPSVNPANRISMRRKIRTPSSIVSPGPEVDQTGVAEKPDIPVDSALPLHPWEKDTRRDSVAFVSHRLAEVVR